MKACFKTWRAGGKKSLPFEMEQKFKLKQSHRNSRTGPQRAWELILIGVGDAEHLPELAPKVARFYFRPHPQLL